MGTWGPGSFENNRALDWVWDLEQTEDLSVVEQAVACKVADDGYLDADVGIAAVAAAEVVAALLGKPSDKLPEGVIAWIEAHHGLDPSHLRDPCLRAMDIVLGEDSELEELWHAAGDGYDAWRRGVETLRDRLRA